MRRAKILLIVIFAVVLCFIWGNSLLSPEASSNFSHTVGEFLSSVFGSGDGNTLAGGLSVRKAAHFTEFCVLGIISFLLLRIFVRDQKLRSSIAALLGILVPVIDETIQIFSGRGSSLRDVWIDAAGYAFGCAIVLSVCFIKKRIRDKGEKRP